MDYMNICIFIIIFGRNLRDLLREISSNGATELKTVIPTLIKFDGRILTLF